MIPTIPTPQMTASLTTLKFAIGGFVFGSLATHIFSIAYNRYNRYNYMIPDPSEWDEYETNERTYEPLPTEPLPTEPLPTEPLPTEPLPTEPLPTEPLPTEPTNRPNEPIQTHELLNNNNIDEFVTTIVDNDIVQPIVTNCTDDNNRTTVTTVTTVPAVTIETTTPPTPANQSYESYNVSREIVAAVFDRDLRTNRMIALKRSVDKSSGLLVSLSKELQNDIVTSCPHTKTREEYDDDFYHPRSYTECCLCGEEVYRR